MQRTKPNNRKKLSEQQNEGETGYKSSIRKGNANQLNFTGEEANGLQVDP